MPTIGKEHVTAGETRGGEPCAPAVNPGADIHLFGREVNRETFAICKSDLFRKSADGREAENVVFVSTLSNDRHAGGGFDYMVANAPYGRDWKRDQDAVREEHDRGAAGRFGPGLRRISSDGQLLFGGAHAGACPQSGRGRVAGRHHHERLAAVHRRRGQRRERDSPVDSRERPILSAVCERNAEVEIYRGRGGRPEPDPESRDTRTSSARERGVVLRARGEVPRPQRLDRQPST